MITLHESIACLSQNIRHIVNVDSLKEKIVRRPDCERVATRTSSSRTSRMHVWVSELSANNSSSSRRAKVSEQGAANAMMHRPGARRTGRRMQASMPWSSRIECSLASCRGVACCKRTDAAVRTLPQRCAIARSTSSRQLLKVAGLGWIARLYSSASVG